MAKWNWPPLLGIQGSGEAPLGQDWGSCAMAVGVLFLYVLVRSSYH